METSHSNIIESKPRLFTVRGVAITVLVLIAVLAAILWYVPVMMRRTVHPIEREEMLSIASALKGFQTEYNKLPQLGIEGEDQYVESKGLLIETLTAKNDTLNPRRIAFYEYVPRFAPASTGGSTVASSDPEVRDPRGNFYRLHFDWNNDGKIGNPKMPGAHIRASVIVYAAGPDGNYDTWDDNFTSWNSDR